MDTVIVLHRWTLTMSTITLSSTGQYWTATLGFADGLTSQCLASSFSLFIASSLTLERAANRPIGGHVFTISPIELNLCIFSTCGRMLEVRGHPSAARSPILGE